MDKKEKREGYNPPPQEPNPPRSPTLPAPLPPGSYKTVLKINNDDILKIILRNPPSKAISIINNLDNVSDNDIKNIEKLLIGIGISCTVIDGKLSLGGI